MILTFLWSFSSRCENVTVHLGFISFVVTCCNRFNRYSYEYTLTKNTIKDIVFQHSHVPRKCSAQCIHVSSIVLFFLSQQHWAFERLNVSTYKKVPTKITFERHDEVVQTRSKRSDCDKLCPLWNWNRIWREWTAGPSVVSNPSFPESPDTAKGIVEVCCWKLKCDL